MEQQEKKTRNNKKWFVIVAMLLLLVAILALGGYTFARYITGTSVPTQQATVAKWGFVVTANADELFSEQYKKGAVVASTESGVDVKVKTPGTDTPNKVVAPGANGKMTFSITGEAEVMSQISLAFSNVQDISIVIKDDAGDETYNPVKWTLKKSATSDGLASATAVTDCDGVTLAEIATYFTTQYSGKIDPNTAVNDYYELSYVWAFQKNVPAEGAELTEAQKAENAKYDAADTALAAVANNADYASEDEYTAAYGACNVTVAFDFALSVEQVQAD